MYNNADIRALLSDYLPRTISEKLARLFGNIPRYYSPIIVCSMGIFYIGKYRFSINFYNNFVIKKHIMRDISIKYSINTYRIVYNNLINIYKFTKYSSIYQINCDKYGLPYKISHKFMKNTIQDVKFCNKMDEYFQQYEIYHNKYKNIVDILGKKHIRRLFDNYLHKRVVI